MTSFFATKSMNYSKTKKFRTLSWNSWLKITFAFYPEPFFTLNSLALAINAGAHSGVPTA